MNPEAPEGGGGDLGRGGAGAKPVGDPGYGPGARFGLRPRQCPPEPAPAAWVQARERGFHPTQSMFHVEPLPIAIVIT